MTDSALQNQRATAEDLAWLEREAAKWQQAVDGAEERVRVSESAVYRTRNEHDAACFRAEVARCWRILNSLRAQREPTPEVEP